MQTLGGSEPTVGVDQMVSEPTVGTDTFTMIINGRERLERLQYSFFILIKNLYIKLVS